MSTQMTQEKLIMYKHLIYNQCLFINQTDVIQNLEFADQLPIFTLKVNFSIGVLFDRVPTKITNLQFTNSPQTNFTGLEQMKQLMTLSLYDNQLSQINFISSLINLTNLNVCSNIIKDLSPLQNLIRLKYLNLEFNKIQDISPLRKLVKLEIIRLNSNQVIDIYPLKYIKELTQLYIRLNKIITIKPLHSLTKLAICDVKYNFIQDISNMPLIPPLEEEDEEMGFGLFDESEEEIVQQNPPKQQLLLSNKITAIYEQQDKFQKEAKYTITTKQGFAQMCNKIHQLLSNSNESHLRWSQCIVQLFQMTDSAISQ
ncbi:leucine-rich_repeat domain-containing protein [Hexamita inflata]|uniref:Leucine-rich_repeat domain-containing protein n=1 Tax=Hexamita inflata TaxID=28002 RepID=A0ABP1GDS9_9EUKA